MDDGLHETRFATRKNQDTPNLKTFNPSAPISSLGLVNLLSTWTTYGWHEKGPLIVLIVPDPLIRPAVLTPFASRSYRETIIHRQKIIYAYNMMCPGKFIN